MADNGDAIAPRSPVDEIIPRLGATDRTRLGEELPVFCERCGYSLHGLAQVRCDSCRVLHFTCPECGHNQPINTLRPAVQRFLGRLRSHGLTAVVFLKINFFFWTLFAWGGLGTQIAYAYNYRNTPGRGDYGTAVYEPVGGFIIFLLAAAFAGVGRMLLLRWRRGLILGLAIGGLVAVALTCGAFFRQWEYHEPLPQPITFDFILYAACALAGACAGAAIVWGIWVALAHAFLPKHAAAVLLEWQRAMSKDVPEAGSAADRATSATA
jgi:hypothetical protein